MKYRASGRRWRDGISSIFYRSFGEAFKLRKQQQAESTGGEDDGAATLAAIAAESRKQVQQCKEATVYPLQKQQRKRKVGSTNGFTFCFDRTSSKYKVRRISNHLKHDIDRGLDGLCG